MNVTSLRKTLLWSFIVFLSITALVAVVSLVGNQFGEEQIRILATTFAISAASICAMSCAAFMEKRGHGAVGLTGMFFAALAAGLSVVLIWAELDSGHFWQVAGVAIVITVSFAHALLLQIPTLAAQYRWTQKVSIFIIVALALEIIEAICQEDDREALWRVIGVTSILVVLVTFVIPICAKLGGNPKESHNKLILQQVSQDTYVDAAGRKFRVTAVEED
jgi:hypothetical protein